jgi:hypothetical protein
MVDINIFLLYFFGILIIILCSYGLYILYQYQKAVTEYCAEVANYCKKKVV